MTVIYCCANCKLLNQIFFKQYIFFSNHYSLWISILIWLHNSVQHRGCYIDGSVVVIILPVCKQWSMSGCCINHLERPSLCVGSQISEHTSPDESVDSIEKLLEEKKLLFYRPERTYWYKHTCSYNWTIKKKLLWECIIDPVVMITLMSVLDAQQDASKIKEQLITEK